MGDLLVLCYHAVSDTWPATLSVSPRALESQMAALARRGYRGARFTDAITEPQSSRTVVVTFDDNYRSVLEIAKPILDRHGYPGTLYVPTDWPDDPRPMRWPGIDVWLDTEHEHELHSLAWADLRKLADDGWEIGSHTCSHPHLPEIDDGDLERELVRSKQTIEAELKRPCTSIAYPYGAVDERVERAAARAGYMGGGSIPRILYAPRPHRWPRTPIFHDDTNLRFWAKTSPQLRRIRSLPPTQRVDRVRVYFASRATRS